MGQPDNHVGQTIGGYRVESVLGAGGMGSVYRAVGPEGEVVALKVVKAELASDEVFRRRFAREARIAQQIRHPNVVPVVDTGEHEGIPYLAQRLLDSGSLEAYLEREGTLDLETAVGICALVAAALDAMHAAGLIHRDIKPGNVLLDEQGNAYITDFGLAKDREGSVLTRPGQALGSLDYMAPEQIRGEEVTPATDIYELACLMSECLCGAPPFADREGMQILWAHLQEEPPDPCSRRSDLPPAVGEVIMRGLEKKPAARPQSAGEFARELKAAAGVSA